MKKPRQTHRHTERCMRTFCLHNRRPAKSPTLPFQRWKSSLLAKTALLSVLILLRKNKHTILHHKCNCSHLSWLLYASHAMLVLEPKFRNSCFRSHFSWVEIKDPRLFFCLHKRLILSHVWSTNLLKMHLAGALLLCPNNLCTWQVWHSKIAGETAWWLPCMATMTGHSKMCTFITHHDATDAASFEGACHWHADCRKVHQSCCPLNLNVHLQCCLWELGSVERPSCRTTAVCIDGV